MPVLQLSVLHNFFKQACEKLILTGKEFGSFNKVRIFLLNSNIKESVKTISVYRIAILRCQ